MTCLLNTDIPKCRHTQRKYDYMQKFSFKTFELCYQFLFDAFTAGVKCSLLQSSADTL